MRLRPSVSLVLVASMASSLFACAASPSHPSSGAPLAEAPSRPAPLTPFDPAVSDDAAIASTASDVATAGPAPAQLAATPVVQGASSPPAPAAQSVAPSVRGAAKSIASKKDVAPEQKLEVAAAPAKPKSRREAEEDRPAEARVVERAPAPLPRTNPMVDTSVDRLSTFAIDVDTASYALARRSLQEGGWPSEPSVRVEEFVNAFDYGYASPTDGAPFRVELASAPSPFRAGHRLVRVALQAKRVSAAERTPVHLVYLVDTSGSMSSPDKLGLAQKSLRLLTETLRPGDTVALCTYAGSVREVLPPTSIAQKSRILSAIDELSAGGSTAMASGIDLAYDLASRIDAPGHVRRVVVLSDGDANVGPTSHEAILRLIEDRKRQGITLSTIGFGTGNYRDELMEQLADKGDGNYAYIDGEREAKRVFQEHVSGLLQVVARDVKVQVEFDPAAVASYRLVGYENRDVADRDFRNDKVDGGEVGAGHSVTALYEIVPRAGAHGGIAVRVRHKPALGGERAAESRFELRADDEYAAFAEAPPSLRFAAGVARFAEVLRGAPGTSRGELGSIAELVRRALPRPDEAQRELVALIEGASRKASAEGRIVAR